MTLAEIRQKLNLDVKCAADTLNRNVSTGYASDLLSDVLANAAEGDIWVTLQVHKNIIAVASMKGISGILLINSRQPDDETIEKAAAENIPIMVSALPAFEVIGRLHAMGISGMRNNAEGV
jgi:hypothetical protein